MRFTDRSERLLIQSPGGVSGPPDGPDWRYQGQTWGMAVADVDGDGRLDLYVNHHTMGPEELITGFATRRAAHTFLEAGPGTETRDQHAATFFDIDQDGDLDLLEARGGAQDSVSDPEIREFWNWLYLNDGGVLSETNAIDQFGELARGPGRDRTLTPMNLDGSIALFAGTVPKEDGSYGSELFVRDAEGIYQTSALITSDVNQVVFAVAAHLGRNAFADVVLLTRSGLTVESDVARNQSPTFEARLGRGLADVQIADLDGDLRQEVIAAHSETGLSVFGEVRGAIVDVTAAARLPDIGGIESLTAGDFDNDGDVDLAAILSGAGATVVVLANRGDGTFRAGRPQQVDGLAGLGDAIVSGDFNADGRLDLVVSSGNGDTLIDGGYGLLMGRPNGNHWLTVSLESLAGERNGLGARVVVIGTDGSRQLREQDSGMHTDVQDATDLHFGLGDATVHTIAVTWADGTVDRFFDVGVDQHIRIVDDALFVV